LASTLFESSELTLIANAMQERWPHWQRPTAVSNPRFRARTEALVEKLARAARRGRSRTRSVRRFSLLELKLMRLALLDRCRRLNESGLTGALAEKLAALVRGRQFIDLPENRVRWGTTIPYLLFNAAAIVGAIFFPPRWQDLLLCLSLYLVRMFAVGGGLHRYFSHKSYSTSRAFQFLLALLATTCGQQGPIWWASQHRHHHRFSDAPEDFHSPTQRGFFWAHQLWVFTDRAQQTDRSTVRDLLKFPELRWLDSHWLVSLVGFALVLLVAGGLRAVEWGFFASTVLLWQVSYGVNSLAHLVGRRRFATADTSRNSWILAILSLGDGWHNNHHFYPGSMRAGFYWWEVDVTGYVIRALAKVGLVWNVRTPPKHVLELGRRRPATPVVA